MHWVEHAAIRPHHCAVIPFVGNSNHQKGFIDTGSEMDGFDNHVYISVVAVEEMATFIGWQSPEAVASLQRQLEKAQAAVSALKEENDGLQKQIEAIDVLTSADFRARHKMGRKPKAKANEEVAA